MTKSTAPEALHLAPNVYDVFRFMEQQECIIIAGYDFIRTDRTSRYQRQAALIGLLIAMASVSEALDVLFERDPNFDDLRKRFRTELDRWKRMRHDAAHIFDRVFKAPRANMNVPWLPGGLKVVAYDPTSDVVSTGNDDTAAVVLAPAIETVFRIRALAELRQHGEPESAYDTYHAPIAEKIQLCRIAVSEAP